jgi:hypothetical protein
LIILHRVANERHDHADVMSVATVAAVPRKLKPALIGSAPSSTTSYVLAVRRNKVVEDGQ